MSSANDVVTIYAPVGGGTFPRAFDRLAGTGTTEDHNSTALNVGALATMVVGENPVRVSFRASTGGSTQVATTDLRYAGGAEVTWTVTPDTRVVYVEAADGSSTYEVWVWQSSP